MPLTLPSDRLLIARLSGFAWYGSSVTTRQVTVDFFTLTTARMVMEPRPVRYASSMPLVPRICAGGEVRALNARHQRVQQLSPHWWRAGSSGTTPRLIPQVMRRNVVAILQRTRRTVNPAGSGVREGKTVGSGTCQRRSWAGGGVFVDNRTHHLRQWEPSWSRCQALQHRR